MENVARVNSVGSLEAKDTMTMNVAGATGQSRGKQVSFKRSQKSDTSRNNDMSLSYGRTKSNDSSGVLNTSSRERNMRLCEQIKLQKAHQSLSPGKKSLRTSSLRKRSISHGSKPRTIKSSMVESRYSVYTGSSPSASHRSSRHRRSRINSKDGG